MFRDTQWTSFSQKIFEDEDDDEFEDERIPRESLPEILAKKTRF